MAAGVCTQDFRSRFKSLFGIAILWRKKSNFIFKPKNKQQLGFAFLKLGEIFFFKKPKQLMGPFFFFQNFPENCVFFHSNNILQRFYRRLNCLFFFFSLKLFKTQLLKLLFFQNTKHSKGLPNRENIILLQES